MRPVKNISKSFFEVGGCYKFGKMRSKIKIESISICSDMICHEQACHKVTFTDTLGAVWCGVEKDMRRISERQDRRITRETC